MGDQIENDYLKKNKFTKPVIGLLLVIIFLIGSALFLINKAIKVNYIIPGVPYYNIWNHRDEGVYFSGETASAVFSVLNYWTPGMIKPAETDKFFKIERKVAETVDRGDVGEYINLVARNQYTVENIVLKKNEIKRYINSRTKTPLIAFLPINENHPVEFSYYPAVVIVGVNESEEKITVHDFWLGNNRDISFIELDKLWERIRPEQRNKYLVIQPKNLKEKIKEINLREIISYPERLSLMDKNEAMIKDYVLGIGAQTALNYNLAKKFFLDIKNNLNFQNDLIPVLKVQVFSRLAAVELQNKDVTGALSYAISAVELNFDIDKPLDNGWLGYEYARVDSGDKSRSSDPYRVLGNIYREMGEREKAIDAYTKALEIDPTLQVVVKALNDLKK